MDPSLSQDQYRLLTKHFQHCIELPRSEWQAYVDRLSLENPELGRNLEGLLRHHQPQSETETPPAMTALAEPSPPTRIRRPRRRAATRVFLVAGLAIALLVLIGQLWALDKIETSLKREAGQSLHGALDVRVAGIRRWTKEKKRQARRILGDPGLAEPLAELAEAARGDGGGLKERLLSHPRYRQIVERARRGLDETGDLGFTLLSPAGVALCADSEARVGRAVGPEGARYVRRVVLDDLIVSRPQPAGELFADPAAEVPSTTMFVGGVIREAGGRMVGLGLIHISPESFIKLLDSPCVEFMAFDDRGLLLTDISRTEPLRKAGLLAGSQDVGGAFRLRLADPGVDLRHGPVPDGASDRWPLTRMGQSGVQGVDGVDSSGQRDLRGQRVLQAWNWLPELEMGVGAQRSEEEVLGSMAPIRTSLWLSVLVFVAAGVVLYLLARHERRRLRANGGALFGSYQLDRRIGRGASADIFLANHAYLKRPAALKILNDADPSHETIERFEREARLASRLGHPNTVQVFDYGEAPDGRLYLAMEYVKGLNLAQLTTLEHPLPVSRVVYILKQIAGSLDEAHPLGLIHRDLKPSNIMIGCRGGIGDLVKVLDFGIASQVAGEAEDVTRSPAVIGTPAFIAPERLRAPLLLDPRSDIYSFGAVAFHLLTGRTVFESDGPTELVYQTLTAPRPSPSQLRGERLPEELESLVLDCLAVSPSARPPTFRAVREKLKAIPLREKW